jgi:hypothetical protein
MTMATWCGNLVPAAWPWSTGAGWLPSNRHDLLFLAGDQAVDLGDVLVGDLLDVGFGALLVVLGGQLVLDQLLDRSLASRRRLRMAILAFRLRCAPAWSFPCGALRSSAGIGTRIRSPMRGRVQAQVAFADGLLDLGAHALFPGLDADRARIEQDTLATWLIGTMEP